MAITRGHGGRGRTDKELVTQVLFHLQTLVLLAFTWEDDTSGFSPVGRQIRVIGNYIYIYINQFPHFLR